MATRADQLCEYCLIHEDHTFFGCEVDHIISEQHGGVTREDNLAFACLVCNRTKGTNIASLSVTGRLTRLFNPRQDRWSEHFRLVGVTISPLTDTGWVTAQILGLNREDRIEEREVLREKGRYPTAMAWKRLVV
ncbi:MAG TPA: HNH endonuclease signature motif containing protein [Thermoanaerobaculia bacterium]|nr:HNH endonuclease signature motif containing protein [Thermoanaerobaculia bacterium]